MATPRVLMVCLGNICRSPIAEGILKHKAQLLGLDVFIDSAGTSNWHQGEQPDGRAMEERRFMWSPTEGLLRVQRTPVPKKSGDGYTKKNKNETIDGPWKQPDEIAAQLGLDSGKDLNSFESLLAAVKKNWTKEKLQYVIDGFKQNNVVQDIGVPEELDDAS